MTQPSLKAPTSAEPDDPSDDDIDFSDIPELGEWFWKDAVVYPYGHQPKKQITMRLDADVIAWFREGGRGYQTRMNAVLRSYMSAQLRAKEEAAE